jgi:hypothetical protein
MWKVTIIESERGWGQKIDQIKQFDSYETAKMFQLNFNKSNDKEYAPDWYMAAEDPVFDSSIIDKKLTQGV